jgi:hypothetical protein
MESLPDEDARNIVEMMIILATPEAEIRRMVVGGQPGQMVCKTLS